MVLKLVYMGFLMLFVDKSSRKFHTDTLNYHAVENSKNHQAVYQNKDCFMNFNI